MSAPSPFAVVAPPRDCPRCPRLVDLREALRIEQPEWWNAPVPAIGDPDAWLLVVGLAPGKHGANRTGRPFTGDAAGGLLFTTLGKFGLAVVPDEGDAQLIGVAIDNAVKCLPPGNRPTPEERRACRPFLGDTLAALPKLQVVIALGEIAHQSCVKALGGKLPKTPFAHLAEHRIPSAPTLIDSYHCSQLNQNTGRLTSEMFEAVFARALALKG